MQLPAKESTAVKGGPKVQILLPSLYNKEKSMKTKICTKCGRQFPVENFYWRDKKAGKRRSDCKDCHNQYVKNKYKENQTKIEQLKSQLKCAKCGDSRGYVLDFHHIDPKEKDKEVSRMISKNYEMEHIMEEIKKCVCLCSNCHREFHYLEKQQNLTLQEYLGSQRNG